MTRITEKDMDKEIYADGCLVIVQKNAIFVEDIQSFHIKNSKSGQESLYIVVNSSKDYLINFDDISGILVEFAAAFNEAKANYLAMKRCEERD